MANYVPFARSNYFKVKDNDAFEAFIDEFDIQALYYEKEDNWCLIFNESIPAWRWVEELDDAEEIYFLEEVSKFLAEGQVVILQEVGFEKMRYLVGYSEAMDWKGNCVSVSIIDIYNKIRKELGITEFSKCEY